MKAVDSHLLTLLKKSTQFVVPIYQRVYSWQEAECDQLWSDIIRAGVTDAIEAVPLDMSDKTWTEELALAHRLSAVPARIHPSLAPLVELITVPRLGNGVFLVIVLTTLIDVIAGFTVTISSARRDFGTSAHTGDQNGDGVVNALDLSAVRRLFSTRPGPSAWHPSGSR